MIENIISSKFIEGKALIIYEGFYEDVLLDDPNVKNPDRDKFLITFENEGRRMIYSFTGTDARSLYNGEKDVSELPLLPEGSFGIGGYENNVMCKYIS